MKVIVTSEFGGADVLRLEDRPRPGLAAGEALVAVEAIGVGYVDVMARQGRYVAFPKPGFVPGLEIAGRIVAVGPGVNENRMGRRVFGMPMSGGGYAEFVALPEAQLMDLPEAMSAADAVALGMNALVARIAIDRASIGKNESVFIRGAGGGIGLMAVQMSAARQAMVSATTSSDARGARLQGLGAQRTLDRSKALEPRDDAYDVVIDTVGGPELGQTIRTLKANGRYVLCGGVGGMPKEDFGMDIIAIYHKSPTFFAFSLNSVEMAEIRAAMQQIIADFDAGLLVPVVDRILPLADAARAHRALESGEVFGKVVLTVG
ncbi:quinone oxidoreductase family protein [Cystobacter fuscus]